MHKSCKLFILLILFTSISLFADTVKQRGLNLLQQYHDKYQNSKKIGKNAKETVNWAYTSLMLKNDKQSIAKANKILSEYLSDNSNYFSNQKFAGHTLYWTLPLMCKMVNDQHVLTKLHPETNQAIKAVLWDFVKNHDKIKWTTKEHLTTVYHSDNHDMLHKGVYLMTAQALKNDPEWANTKYPDGKSPKEHFDAYVKFLMEYFRQRAMNGTTIETGASAYSGVYLQPIIIIYDCCENEHLKKQAGKYLDLFFADVAQETINGLRGGAKVRMYKNDSSYLAHYDRQLDYNHLFAGQPKKLPDLPDTFCFGAIPTDYRVDDLILEVMTNPAKRGEYAYISNRLGQGDHWLLEIGEDRLLPVYEIEIPSGIYRYSYCTPDYILGWFTVDEGQHYTLINSQNQWMGLITSQDLNSRIVFQCTPTSAMDNRVSFRDITAVGDKHSMLIRKQLAALDAGQIRVYISDDFDLHKGKNSWIFGKNKSGVYYALKAASRKNNFYGELKGVDISGDDLFVVENTEKYPGRFVRFLNNDAILVFEVANADEYPDFDDFKKDIVNRNPEYTNNLDECNYQPSRGAAKLTMYVDLRRPEVDNQPLSIFPEWTYKSPYIESPRGSDVVTLKGLEGSSKKMDFSY